MPVEVCAVGDGQADQSATSAFLGRHVLVVVAHPDDEVLGIGGQLPSVARLTLVMVTDGAPSSGDARAKGFGSRRAYAAARHRELRNALDLMPVPRTVIWLGIRDLEASFIMARLARKLGRIISRIRPDVVVTHAFEGGHPDHDAVAFAVHAAIKRAAYGPPLWELTGYRREAGRVAFGRFQPLEHGFIHELPLGDQAFELKRRMLDCFVSQADVIARFPALRTEEFRQAPHYRFTQLRPAKDIGYDVEGWRIAEPLWRSLASLAEASLQRGQAGLIANLRNSLALHCLRWAHRENPARPRLVRLLHALAGSLRATARDD